MAAPPARVQVVSMPSKSRSKPLRPPAPPDRFRRTPAPRCTHSLTCDAAAADWRDLVYDLPSTGCRRRCRSRFPAVLGGGCSRPPKRSGYYAEVAFGFQAPSAVRGSASDPAARSTLLPAGPTPVLPCPSRVYLKTANHHVRAVMGGRSKPCRKRVRVVTPFRKGLIH